MISTSGRRRIDGNAADLHPLRQVGGDGDLLAGVLDGDAVQRDLAGRDQGLDVAPAAVAEIGQQAVQARHQGLCHLRAS
jgi:hypothetical protein